MRAALADNLCRCGTHNRIIRAVLRAQKGRLTMNAPHLTRRDFLKSAGGIVLAFSGACRGLAQQAAARLPGSLQTNRMLDALAPRSTRTAPSRCSPASASSARAS